MDMRTRLPLRLLAIVAAVGLAFGSPAAFAQESPAPEETSSTSDSGGDNLALAINTKDDSSVVKFAFQVRRVMNGVVDQTNAAVAFASCENCRTVAVAIQIVMVMNDPDVVSPTNLALAYNYECTTCETLASAYQFVFSTDGLAKFTTDGWRALVDIRNQVQELLKDESLDIVTLQAELDVLMDQVAVIVDEELEPIGPEDGSDPSAAPEETATPEPEMTPDDSTSSTPAPEPTEEEPSPSPSE